MGLKFVMFLLQINRLQHYGLSALTKADVKQFWHHLSRTLLLLTHAGAGLHQRETDNFRPRRN